MTAMETGGFATCIALWGSDLASLASSRHLGGSFPARRTRSRPAIALRRGDAMGSMRATETGGKAEVVEKNGPENLNSSRGFQPSNYKFGIASNAPRKTKIVCTIGPSTNTREMIWKLAEAGMNVARLNMSHGDHASHKKIIDLVKKYNAQSKDNVIAIMLDTKSYGVYSGQERILTGLFLTMKPYPTDTRMSFVDQSSISLSISIIDFHPGAELQNFHGDSGKGYLGKEIDLTQELEDSWQGPEVRSGDVPQPIVLREGQEFNFTIKRGVSSKDTVSVNYDDFVNDVEVGDILLVDGGMMSLMVKSKTTDMVKCEVCDGGELKSRRHLNVRGKSATLPSITEKDWDDIKFGVENKVDFYAVSFVKDAKVVHELKDYLQSCNADIHVIVKIESADAVPNLQSIISASDGAMVARGDLGAELPVEEVPLLQEEIIRRCHSMEKPVIVATNMLESMIDHPTPTRAEVSDIAIAVQEGADGIMLSGETAHGKFPLKAIKVMHTVALRTESTLSSSINHAVLSTAVQAIYGEDCSQSHMSAMFASHATAMSNNLGTPIIVFTRTGSMAIRLSHYQPSSTIFAFTNEERVKQRLVLYHGVLPIYMQFSDDVEETFCRAISCLLKGNFLKEGEYVTLVQSGTQSIWRQESTHQIQVRKVQG